MRGRVNRWSRQAMLSMALTASIGCTGVYEEGLNGNGGSGSCAMRARLDGRWYVPSGGIVVIPAYGDLLGSADVAPCGNRDGFRIAAARIEGVSPEVAFASPQYEEAIFLAEGIGSFPPELRHLRDEPKCTNANAPILLRGQWLGIIGADGKTEVDLVPPYDLSMRVGEASSTRFERAFLTIHVGTGLGRPLSREDLRSSLWEGGNLSITATCIDGEFWAEHVTASAPS